MAQGCAIWLAQLGQMGWLDGCMSLILKLRKFGAGNAFLQIRFTLEK